MGLARVVLGGRLPPGPPGRAVPGESGREVRVASPVEVPVEIPPAPDPEGILVNWLTFLIILLETEGLVYHWGDLTVRGVAAELTLTGTVLAWRPGPGSLRRPVKAATYHGLAVTTDRQGVRRARIILDV